MTVGAISVDEDTPFKQIVDILELHGFNAVPVVDRSDRVVGLVSSADLVPKIEFAGDAGDRHLFENRRHRAAREKATGTAAGELMNAPAVTVMPQTSLVEAAKIMEASDLKRMPVVDDLGRLVGMVTRGDLLKVFLREDGDIRREIQQQVLTDIAGVQPTQVTVEVDDGVVTLLGRLDRSSLIRTVVRQIERVDGVIDVVNDLTYDDDDDLERDPSASTYAPTMY
jgi:CBS-domain-containing membrane protein